LYASEVRLPVEERITKSPANWVNFRVKKCEEIKTQRQTGRQILHDFVHHLLHAESKMMGCNNLGLAREVPCVDVMDAHSTGQDHHAREAKCLDLHDASAQPRKRKREEVESDANVEGNDRIDVQPPRSTQEAEQETEDYLETRAVYEKRHKPSSVEEEDGPAALQSTSTARGSESSMPVDDDLSWWHDLNPTQKCIRLIYETKRAAQMELKAARLAAHANQE
jgi:hypothetical protein